MNKAKAILFILLALLGVFLFGYGGYDDSPGAQGLGLLFAVLGVVGVAKSRKKKPIFK